ncbi:hypothetical protein Agub_g16003, partial [Astrephomene gubernaculifera]
QGVAPEQGAPGVDLQYEGLESEEVRPANRAVGLEQGRRDSNGRFGMPDAFDLSIFREVVGQTAVGDKVPVQVVQDWLHNIIYLPSNAMTGSLRTSMLKWVKYRDSSTFHVGLQQQLMKEMLYLNMNYRSGGKPLCFPGKSVLLKYPIFWRCVGNNMFELVRLAGRDTRAGQGMQWLVQLVAPEQVHGLPVNILSDLLSFANAWYVEIEGEPDASQARKAIVEKLAVLGVCEPTAAPAYIRESVRVLEAQVEVGRVNDDPGAGVDSRDAAMLGLGITSTGMSGLIRDVSRLNRVPSSNNSNDDSPDMDGAAGSRGNGEGGGGAA